MPHFRTLRLRLCEQVLTKCNRRKRAARAALLLAGFFKIFVFIMKILWLSRDGGISAALFQTGESTWITRLAIMSFVFAA